MEGLPPSIGIIGAKPAVEGCSKMMGLVASQVSLVASEASFV